MDHSALSDQTLTQSAITIRAATGVVNGAAIDTQGWDGVEFTVPYGIFGTNGTLDVGPVQIDDNSGFNSPTNIANSSATQIAAANANGLVIVDVYRPQERYVRLQITGQTNGVTTGATAKLYRRTGILPPTQSAAQVVKVVTG